MGEARDAANRMTAAALEPRDVQAVAARYTEDAVAVTPDQGRITGRDNIAEYIRPMRNTSISPSTSPATWRLMKGTSSGRIPETSLGLVVRAFRRRASRCECETVTLWVRKAA
jgi:hypothetical protein